MLGSLMTLAGSVMAGAGLGAMVEAAVRAATNYQATIAGTGWVMGLGVGWILVARARERA